MKNINFKLPEEDKKFLERLVIAGNYKSVAQIMRTATEEFISKYTNRPTLMGLGQRQDRQQARLDRVEEELRNIRKQLAETE